MSRNVHTSCGTYFPARPDRPQRLPGISALTWPLRRPLMIPATCQWIFVKSSWLTFMSYPDACPFRPRRIVIGGLFVMCCLWITGIIG